MELDRGSVPTERIADLLGHVRRKGIRLWSEDGRLRYSAPKGALTQDEIRRLRLSKTEILALLEPTGSSAALEPSVQAGPRLERAPLAFTQQSYLHYYTWHGAELDGRSVRFVASGLHLRGRLDGGALRNSVGLVVRRHDALRTRIVEVDGAEIQQIDPHGEVHLDFDDLSALAGATREQAIQQSIAEAILEPIDVARGPLLGLRLIRLSDTEHVLILAMDHMISDGTSLQLLARELLTAYAQFSSGRALRLPAIPMQFPDYALWQQNTASTWIERHAPYWQTRLAGCRRLPFPEDRTDRIGWAAAPILIDGRLKTELTEWCRRRGTTVVMTVFAAYVALVLRWCEVAETVILYQSNGRTSTKIENTIGFFASILHLRVALEANDSWSTLAARVMEEYCRANEHADFSYVMAQTPRPDFTRNTSFNWTPRGSRIDVPDGAVALGGIAHAPYRFASPVLPKLAVDCEPGIQLYDADPTIAGNIFYPAARFSEETMARLARNFVYFVRTLVRQSDERVSAVPLL